MTVYSSFINASTCFGFKYFVTVKRALEIILSEDADEAGKHNKR